MRLLFHAVVLQDDDLEIRVIAFVQNTIDTLLQHRGLVTRRNDDGNQRMRYGKRIANTLVNLEFAWFHFSFDLLGVQMLLHRAYGSVMCIVFGRGGRGGALWQCAPMIQDARNTNDRIRLDLGGTAQEKIVIL